MTRISVALAAIMLASPATAQEKAAPAGDVKRGEQIYISDGCWQCHGLGAAGAALTGPRLVRTTMPFEAFVAQLRKPASDMPPYEAAVISEEKIADIYAYVKSLPEASDLKSLPLLQKMGLK